MPLRFLSLLLMLAFLLPAHPLRAQVSWELRQTIKPQEAPLDVASSMDGSRIYVLTRGGMVKIYSSSGATIGTIEVDPKMERISAVGLQAAGIPEKIILTGPQAGVVQELSLEFAVPIDTSGAPFMGRADAPVEIVEFSDFECPYCSRVKPLTDKIMESYPDQVKLVFKHFPLSFHKQAKPAALASMAAQKQGKFWEFHDLLFANQKSLSPERIRAIARELDLDMARFDRDLKDPEQARGLEKDMQDGQKAGVRGTPTIFVNGMLLKQRDLPTLKRMIDLALKK